MLDSKEIAKKALHRAEVMRAQKKRRLHKWMQTTAMLLCTCCITAVAAVYLTSVSEQSYTIIDDEQPPLAAFPFEENENAPGFLIPGYETFMIPANETDVKISLVNPDSNSYDLVYKIVLSEPAEVLYTSEVIPPSSSIESITLAKAFQEGEYPAMLIITAYEPGSFTAVGEVTVEVGIFAAG